VENVACCRYSVRVANVLNRDFVTFSAHPLEILSPLRSPLRSPLHTLSGVSHFPLPPGFHNLDNRPHGKLSLMLLHTLDTPLYLLICLLSFYPITPLVLPCTTIHPPQSSSNPPIVLLHGLLGNRKNFNTLAATLATTASTSVHALDLRNHGSKETWSNETTYAAMASDVVETLESFSIPKCVLIGHSMGGKVAMSLATSPDQHLLDGLICIDIAPVTYSSDDSTSWSFITAIIDACATLPLHSLPSKKAADEHLSHQIPDLNLRSFVLTNLGKSQEGLHWKM